MAKKIFAALALAAFITILVLGMLRDIADKCDTVDVAYTDNALEIHFFGSATCGECLDIKNAVLNPLVRELDGRLRVFDHDTDRDTAYKLMLSMERFFGVTDPAPQMLFFPDTKTVLLGFTAIMEGGRAAILEYVNDPTRPRSIAIGESDVDFEGALKKRVNISKFWFILGAAAVDSINPCAIATIVFLVSFLATQKRKRSEILIVGLSFTGAVFITYLLLGVGVFAVLTALSAYCIAARIIKWLAIALAGGVGIVSLVDAFRYKKTNDAKSVTLQLPKSVKMRIHKIITTQMKGSRLVVGAIVTGFLVTLLEAVCTGQVYLPAISMMAQSEGALRLTGWLYLIIYNFIFVVPLLVVMAATYYGMRWNQLSKMAMKHLALSKILLGSVMLGLAIYMYVAL